jgi:hypothetical protein
MWKSAGRAPSLRVLPWHLPYNWGKSTKKPVRVRKTSVRLRKPSFRVEKPHSEYLSVLRDESHKIKTQDSRVSGRDLKPRPPKHDTRVLRCLSVSINVAVKCLAQIFNLRYSYIVYCRPFMITVGRLKYLSFYEFVQPISFTFNVRKSVHHHMIKVN